MNDNIMPGNFSPTYLRTLFREIDEFSERGREMGKVVNLRPPPAQPPCPVQIGDTVRTRSGEATCVVGVVWDEEGRRWKVRAYVDGIQCVFDADTLTVVGGGAA